MSNGFSVEFRRGTSPGSPTGGYVICLIDNNWDDWFKFETTFNIGIWKPDKKYYSLGELKVGQKGLTSEKRRPAVPSYFTDSIGSDFFSLGQSESYYEAVRELGGELAERIFSCLRDCAYDENIYIENRSEESMQVSLLRSISESEIRGRFRRLAYGDATLTPYSFEFAGYDEENPLSLAFEVIPESVPPTNVHVMIGRNGVGKTYLMQQMQKALLQDEEAKLKIKISESMSHGMESPVDFAGIIAVSFSAFDEFKSKVETAYINARLKIDYVGLRDHSAGAPRTKTPRDLTKDWIQSISKIRMEAKSSLLRRVIESLNCDPIFSSLDVAKYSLYSTFEEAEKFFDLLSSGHKIVLLTMTELVRLVGERTLVLLDEPEAHLHPPLLAAFVRSLSDLLVSRNGVAIIATHSPVILQEVPAVCSWILNRSGRIMVAQRPGAETFGENVGIISHSVFSLEVTESGYNSLIKRVVRENPRLDYEELLGEFSGQLGLEGRSLLRVALAGESDL